ncbi:MAG TPA: hypothetical protein VIQ30_25805 [Pseudonocardia sp.]
MSIPKISPRNSTVPATMQLPARPPEQGRHRFIPGVTPVQFKASYFVKARKQAHR